MQVGWRQGRRGSREWVRWCGKHMTAWSAEHVSVFFYAKKMCSCSGIMVAHEVAETLIQVQLRWTHSILVSQKGRQESQPGRLISLAGLRGKGP